MTLIEGAKSKFCQARPVPIALEETVAAELSRLERMGVISPVHDGGVDNTSPVVWIKKPNGQLRMCVDFKMHVNAEIKNDAYPTPPIETIFF